MNYVRAVLNWQTLLAAFFILLPTMLGFYHGDRHKYIVASSMLDDPAFKDTVIYLFDHQWYQARGLVLNVPYTKQDSLPPVLREAPFPVYWGGPVGDMDQVFVMSLCDETLYPVVRPFAELKMSFAEFFEWMRNSPECYRLYVGFAGWGIGQYELEKKKGYWYSAPFIKTEFKQTPADQLRDAVLPKTEDKLSPSIKLR